MKTNLTELKEIISNVMKSSIKKSDNIKYKVLLRKNYVKVYMYLNDYAYSFTREHDIVSTENRFDNDSSFSEIVNNILKQKSHFRIRIFNHN